MDEYAGHVAVLPTGLFSSLMQSLQWGLDAPVERAQTQRLSLQAMTAMAEHGLRAFVAGGADAVTYSAESQHGAALVHFLQVSTGSAPNCVMNIPSRRPRSAFPALLPPPEA